MPPQYTNMRLGSCDTVDPCATCPSVCMTANPSNQAAALPGSSASIQAQSNSSITIVESTGTCPTGSCLSPNDCCESIATSLKLPYSLYYPSSVCPSPSQTVSCIPDQASPDYCRNNTCYQMMRDDKQGSPFWYCSAQQAGTADINFSFTNPNECNAAITNLNATWIGIECDPNLGARSCVVGQTGCTSLSDIKNAPADIVTNLSKYLGGGARALSGFQCIPRTTKCPTDGPASCSFSTDPTLVDCQTCGNVPCGLTGWVCQPDATVGAVCQQTSDSANTIDQACASMGASSTCGCACLFPGQVCSQGKVLGKPCEVQIPNINNVLLPLSAACGDGTPMRSSQVWSPSQQKCVYGVPILDSGSFTTYQPPTQVDPNNVCPN
jgi:hypothetical protein